MASSSRRAPEGAQVALIGDLVGSRKHTSRAEAQQSLVDALQVANEQVPSVQALEPTIADEFQGVYDTIGEALLATLVVRLALPEPMDARCGLGIGPIEIVGASAYGLTQDGQAWWSAREAVDTVKDRERRLPGLRTWLGGQEEETNVMNGYVLCRDEVVSALDARGRRLALGLLAGRSHADLADDEGVSASAVSQRARRNGLTALVESAQRFAAGAVPITGAGA